MTSIASKVEQLVTASAFLTEGMVRGLINLSELARQMREHIEQAVQDATQITLTDFVQEPLYKRAWYELAFWMYLGLMRIVTWGEYA